ncbi:MAG TPA: glycerophosphodiester phosphodiesterase [Actinomycetota bacterium]
MADHAFPDGAFPTIVAHRGASSTHPENTLASFRAALALGAPVVELDVRLTADAVPVVMHDADVARTTGGEGLVHELTAERIAELNAGTPDAPEPVPTLRQALELMSGAAAVALEIKNVPGDPGFAEDERIVEAAHEELVSSGFEGPALVLSFNPRSLAASKAIDPAVPTGFLTTDLVPPPEALAHAVETGHDLVLPRAGSLIPAGPAFVAEAHAEGVRVGTWTVDDPRTLRMLLDRGVDAIATNDPAMALAVLAGHARAS